MGRAKSNEHGGEVLAGRPLEPGGTKAPAIDLSTWGGGECRSNEATAVPSGISVRIRTRANVSNYLPLNELRTDEEEPSWLASEEVVLRFVNTPTNRVGRRIHFPVNRSGASNQDVARMGSGPSRGFRDSLR